MELVNPITGIRCWYEDRGQGAPVVILIHGWSANHTRWSRVHERLVEKYRVIHYDLRGHGLSEKEPQRDYSLGAYVLDLLGMMNALGVDRAVLAGHSMGGMIAQQFALAFPERVEKLVLVGTCARVAESEKARRSLVRFSKVFLSYFKFAMWYKDRDKRKKPDLFPDVQDPRYSPTPESTGLSLLSIAHYDIRRRIPDLNIPALTLATDEDDTVPYHLSVEMHELLPDSRLVTLNGFTHHFPLEDPERVFNEMDTFLSG